MRVIGRAAKADSVADRGLEGRSRGADAVFDGVLDAVARQRLPPGTKLGEENLAQIFTVSRAQVRAALSRLKGRGLVDMEPNRTAAIASPSVLEVRSIFALRRWIEPELVAEVAQSLNRHGEAMLREHLEREQAARDTADRVEAVRLSGLFHTAIASLSGNRLAASYVAELVDRSFLAIYLYQRPGSVVCVNEEHLCMMDAISRRDPKGAYSAVADHLDHILSRLDLQAPQDAALDLKQAFRGIV